MLKLPVGVETGEPFLYADELIRKISALVGFGWILVIVQCQCGKQPNISARASIKYCIPFLILTHLIVHLH